MNNTIYFKLNPSKTSRTITITMELKQVENKRSYDNPNQVVNGVVLSLRGSIRKGNGCCQMQDYIKTYLNRFRSNDIDDITYILDVWNKYHLNDLHAGTRKQEEWLHANGYTGWANNYTETCKALEEVNLLVDNGYKFGCGWLFEEIPQEVISKLEEIFLRRKEVE